MAKMSGKEKKQKKKKFKCFSDFVEEVPKIITDTKTGAAYQQLHFIGSGSYGKCFEVVKLATGERFACKILSKLIIRDSEFLGLVQNEINIHRKLQHKHIVEFMKSFEDDKLIYIIQSLCSNNSLRDLHKARGVVSVAECRYFISQILKGAQYIHDNQYIHRDLKLTNILIDKSMQMKICDFGLAIRADDPRLDKKTLCGTTNYLAPEVVGRKGFAYVSDVWAIGVIAFVLLFGYKPFEECDAYATHQRILRADYAVPSDSDSELKSFLKCTFQKEVEYRSSAEECLRLDFFKKHYIPESLPFETFTQSSLTADTNRLSSYTLKEINLSKYLSEKKTEVVEYPKMCVEMEPVLKFSYENVKYAYEMDKAFQGLDTICRYVEIDNGHSFNDLSELDNYKPEYWISKWSFDKSITSGFAYQMSDGSTGILFHDGVRLMRTPDNDYHALEYGNDRFWRIRGECVRLNRRLQEFRNFENILENNGVFEPETPYNQRRTTYLYTWFQTDNAVVMLLSDNTIQINFMGSHKKVLISPERQKIAFITGMMTAENFKTASFVSLTQQSFSVLSCAMLKYVTAAVLHLADKLKGT